MCWKTTLYGFSLASGDTFTIEIIAAFTEIDDIILTYLELPNVLLHTVESEKLDEC